MDDCTAAALMWVPHASVDGTYGVVLCDKKHQLADDPWHDGQIGEYDATLDEDGGTLVMLFPTRTAWHNDDRRNFDANEQVVPILCTWTDEHHRQCCLPADHRGNHAP